MTVDEMKMKSATRSKWLRTQSADYIFVMKRYLIEPFEVTVCALIYDFTFEIEGDMNLIDRDPI